MKQKMVIRLCVAVLTSATLACNLSAPLRPTPPAVSGDTSGGATLKVSAPAPQSPVNGLTLAGVEVTGITLSASAAVPTHAPSASLQYEFELMNNGGTVIERSGVQGGSTWTQTSTLDFDARYTWRVRAVLDGAAGPWSDTFAFTTPNLPPHFRCGPPFYFSPLDIITCHRAEFESLDNHHEFVVFLRRVARDLNKAGVEGGPFGLLVKTIGNNCDGYSCDILCAQNGSDHDQWDILLDENFPQFNELDDPTVRPCEIQGSQQVLNDE